MSTKTKTIDSFNTGLADAAQNLGLILMTAAATVGMLELPHNETSRVVVPNQPALVAVTSNEDTNPLRREREESAPHHISYSAFQRTPGRTGKQ